MARIAIILVLPVEYNTSSMLRCRSIISALAEMGHEIKCYCPNPDKNSKYFSKEKIEIPGMQIYRFGKIAWSSQDNTKSIKGKQSIKSIIKGIGLGVFHKVDVFGSTLLYLPERKKVSDDISKGNFDILISFSDPMPAHMIGKYVKQHNQGLRYIQQWGDPLASDTISKIAQPVWMRKIIENSLLKQSDRVCYVSPFTCEEQKTIFPKQAKKMIFLPTPSLQYSEETVEREDICIGYFGSYNSVARDLRPFYEAAKLNPNIKFLIIGDSDIQLDSTENITVINRVSHDELNKYMQQINVIVCLMNSKGNQIPGKVYHDASSTKDILFIKDGEYGDKIQEFFQKYDHYTFVDNNVESIDKAIKNYLNTGVPVRKPVVDFQAVNIAGRLIES